MDAEGVSLKLFADFRLNGSVFVPGSLVGQYQLHYDPANGGECNSSKERMRGPDLADQTKIPEYDAPTAETKRVIRKIRIVGSHVKIRNMNG